MLIQKMVGLWLFAKNIKDTSWDFHDDTTAEFFENWFRTCLLPNILEDNAIIMDNPSVSK